MNSADINPATCDDQTNAVYEISVNSGGTVKTMYAVPAPESMGFKRGHGDALFNTRAEAEQYLITQGAIEFANMESRRQASEAEASRKAAEAERLNVGAFGADKSALQLGKIKATLSAPICIKGVVSPLKDAIKTLLAEGATPRTAEEDIIKPMSRLKFFRSDNYQQAAHEQKIKDAGKKTVYMIGGYELGKTAYDYALFLYTSCTTADDAISRSVALGKTVFCDDSDENRYGLALRSGEVIVNENTIDYFGIRWCVAIKIADNRKPPA